MISNILLFVISVFTVSCFYSSKTGLEVYGVRKGDVFRVKDGIYVHKDMDLLGVGSEPIGNGLIKSHSDYKPVSAGSRVKIKSIKTKGKWSTVSRTEIYGDLIIGENKYINVLLNAIFVDPEKSYKKSNRYSEKIVK